MVFNRDAFLFFIIELTALWLGIKQKKEAPENRSLVLIF